MPRTLFVTCILLLACGGEGKHALAPGAADRVAAAEPAPRTVPASEAAVLAAAAAEGKHIPSRKRGKWRDAGLYVDGEHLATMWFGELPRDLEPVWVDSIEDLDFKPGDDGPRQRIVKQRRYRVADYLEALDVDVATVEMVHIHGGAGHVAAIPGDRFRKWRDELLFAFGGETQGKAIPIFPPGMPINTNFDRIGAIAVYAKLPAPEIDDDFFPLLEGERVAGLPYVGTPPRGGVRVYKDDRLAAIIKRRRLADSGVPLIEELDGHQSFELFPALAALGVELSDVRSGEVIYDERRIRTLSRDELASASVKAISGRSGQVRFRDGTEMQALALYTHELRSPPPVVD